MADPIFEHARLAAIFDALDPYRSDLDVYLGIAIGAGSDVAIKTADIVLMRSDPLDVATAINIGRGTVRKELQNLA
jgi:Cu2+-exporting ATPase